MRRRAPGWQLGSLTVSGRRWIFRGAAAGAATAGAPRHPCRKATGPRVGHPFQRGQVRVLPGLPTFRDSHPGAPVFRLRSVLGDLSPHPVDDLGPSPGGGGDLGGQQRLERLSERTCDVLGVVDEDLLEDGLVELSPDTVGGEGECFRDSIGAGFGSFESSTRAAGGLGLIQARPALVSAGKGRPFGEQTVHDGPIMTDYPIDQEVRLWMISGISSRSCRSGAAPVC